MNRQWFVIQWSTISNHSIVDLDWRQLIARKDDHSKLEIALRDISRNSRVQPPIRGDFITTRSPLTRFEIIFCIFRLIGISYYMIHYIDGAWNCHIENLTCESILKWNSLSEFFCRDLQNNLIYQLYKLRQTHPSLSTTYWNSVLTLSASLTFGKIIDFELQCLAHSVMGHDSWPSWDTSFGRFCYFLLYRKYENFQTEIFLLWKILNYSEF